ncbi:MAG: FliM/FliN family flagellar motor switch protein, partial [Calditrichaeota bacterium]|nr:FliM/FliN family flagellar motor switch protein [Calditrichota bacterium]
LDLERGSIVELDKMAGEPVDLYINNKKMAEGEVVVVDKHFGVRITNLIDPADRIKNLGNP